MTYQELINNIRDLGFGEDSDITDFGDAVPNGINRAISIIAETYPVIERYEFDIEGTETGYVYITMPDEDDNFLDFAQTPVLFAETSSEGEKSRYTKFNDFEIEAGDTVVINADNVTNGGKMGDTTYTFRIFYKADPEKFDGRQLGDDIPLPRKAHHLVPLLASYYIWLDDEPVKAAQYYNQYETSLVNLETRSSDNKPRVRILSGGI